MTWEPDPQLDATDYLIVIVVTIILIVVATMAILVAGWGVLVLPVAAVGAWVYLVKRRRDQ
jgi:fatty acid desaturase